MSVAAEPPSPASSEASSETISIKLPPADLLLIGATFGLIFFLFFPALKEIALICWNDEDYSHGLLLPVVAAYMYWDDRVSIIRRLRAGWARSGRESLLVPELLLLAGLFGFFVGQASGISFTSWVAFFPTVVAALWLLLGRAAALTLAPPILLLYMAKPLPDSIVVRLFWPLQVFAAKVSKITLDLFNVPTFLNGNIIEIPGMRLLVEEACSGMRSVMALLTLALIVIYFIELRLFFKLLLIALALLVAVVLNVTRVALTGLLAHFYDPSTATGFFHTFSGMIVFIVGLPILYYLGVQLMKLDGRMRRSGENAADEGSAKA